MIHFKSIAIVALSFCLMGADSLSGFHWLKVGEKEASAIQWNEQYMVTAKHVDFLVTPGVACPSGCDLQFVRSHRDISTRWRKAADMEWVRVVGVTAGQGMVEREGRILPGRRSIVLGGPSYQMVEAKISKGMSGGPIYGADGAVLGMVVAFIDPAELAKHPVLKELRGLGLFLSTADIQREWLASGLVDEPEGPCRDGDCD